MDPPDSLSCEDWVKYYARIQPPADYIPPEDLDKFHAHSACYLLYMLQEFCPEEAVRQTSAEIAARAVRAEMIAHKGLPLWVWNSAAYPGAAYFEVYNSYSNQYLLSMLQRFSPEEAVRISTDSVRRYKQSLLTKDSHVSPAQWRDKGEKLRPPNEHAAYYAEPEHVTQQKEMTRSIAPHYDDPLSSHRLSYLNGGGGSGKTTRAIELFRAIDPLVLTPTHRLAKEMRARGYRPRHTMVSSDIVESERPAQQKKTSSNCSRQASMQKWPTKTGRQRIGKLATKSQEWLSQSGRQRMVGNRATKSS